MPMNHSHRTRQTLTLPTGGVPGSGKTALCAQLCMSVQIPVWAGGPGGTAVFIDTEGALLPARLVELAQALERRLRGLARRRGDAAGITPPIVPGWREFLAGVKILRCSTAAEQAHALAVRLPQVIAEAVTNGDAPVRLVVLDSVACHQRYGEGTFFERDRHLRALAQGLHRIAAERAIAVVLTNHMTVRFGVGGDTGATSLQPVPGTAAAVDAAAAASSAILAMTLGDGTLLSTMPASTRTAAQASCTGAGSSSVFGSAAMRSGTTALPLTLLVPALGAAWSHAATDRLALGFALDDAPAARRAGARAACLCKSAARPSGGVALFAICGDGVRSRAIAPGCSTSETTAVAASTPSAVHAPTGLVDSIPDELLLAIELPVPHAPPVVSGVKRRGPPQ